LQTLDADRPLSGGDRETISDQAILDCTARSSYSWQSAGGVFGRGEGLAPAPPFRKLKKIKLKEKNQLRERVFAKIDVKCG